MNAAALEILWSNIVNIVNEQAKVLQRTAFSSIVRDAGDLACAMFDLRGRMVAQSVTGTPGHINSLAACGGHLIERFPPVSLMDGDVIITNDPWLGAGHFFDITILTPVFRDGKPLAFYGSTIHHTDIGGYGHGAGARDVYQEGLWIPPLKLYRAGVMDEVLEAMLRQNVRMPSQLFGDLSAQVSSARVAGERLLALMDRQRLADIEEVSNEIITRSEAAMRSAIRKIPSGTYPGATEFDVPGGDIVKLNVALTVDAEAGDITIDFAGSSPISPIGINVCMNYTHAYGTYAVASCLAPDLPNNHGSLAPIHVVAPKDAIVNCQPPAPVNARHVVGMYVPMPILKALAKCVPDRVIAESSGASWAFHVYGKRSDGSPFIQFWGASGGMGARKTKDGLSATKYPTGVSVQPIEIIEAASPVLFLEKQLRRGSGGDGKTRGGDGQSLKFKVLGGRDWVFDAVLSRMKTVPEGLDGGDDGQAGVFLINGKAVPERDQINKISMTQGDIVECHTPGGGGYGRRATNQRED